jgi:hypothetical protein
MLEVPALGVPLLGALHMVLRVLTMSLNRLLS